MAHSQGLRIGALPGTVPRFVLDRTLVEESLVKLSAALTAAVLTLGLAAAPATATAPLTSPTVDRTTTTTAAAPATTVVAKKPARRKVRMKLRRAVQSLKVARETRAGYQRSKFRHWIDADRDCRDTRAEVLAAESRQKVRGGCHISTGLWRSWYDGRVHTAASGLDIDHMVPLAEAWDSGAKKWNADTRKRFANDLGDHRSLVAVTNSVNRSKSDRDPAQWLPTKNRCRYISHWTAVKVRWRLNVDKREKRALLSGARGQCSKATVKVTEAKVATKKSKQNKKKKRGNKGLDPRFSACYKAKAAGYGPYYKGRDPEYKWYRDADSDGIVCE